MNTWIGAAILAGLSLCTTAMADYQESGAGLLNDCKTFISQPEKLTRTDFMNGGRCLGNMESVITTLKTLSEGNLIPPLICPRNVENMSNEVVARIIIKYLEDNPKQLSNDRTSLVMLALIDAMPCK